MGGIVAGNIVQDRSTVKGLSIFSHSVNKSENLPKILVILSLNTFHYAKIFKDNNKLKSSFFKIGMSVF